MVGQGLMAIMALSLNSSIPRGRVTRVLLSCDDRVAAILGARAFTSTSRWLGSRWASVCRS